MPTDTENKTSTRVVRHLSVLYFSKAEDLVTGLPTRSVQSATRGEEIDLIPAEEKRLDDLGALLPKGADPEDVDKEHQAVLDVFRGERGDTEAMQRAVARASKQTKPLHDGGIVNVEANVEGRSTAQLADWLVENKPSVDDTVALAEGDSEKAAKVLEAENIASEGSPRKGVSDRLEKIAQG